MKQCEVTSDEGAEITKVIRSSTYTLETRLLNEFYLWIRLRCRCCAPVCAPNWPV